MTAGVVIDAQSMQQMISEGLEGVVLFVNDVPRAIFEAVKMANGGIVLMVGVVGVIAVARMMRREHILGDAGFNEHLPMTPHRRCTGDVRSIFLKLLAHQGARRRNCKSVLER